MWSNTAWHPMPMILIARPRIGLGMDLDEGPKAPLNPGTPRTSTIASRPGTYCKQPTSSII